MMVDQRSRSHLFHFDFENEGLNIVNFVDVLTSKTQIKADRSFQFTLVSQIVEV